MKKLTPDAETLFTNLAEDAGNWSGTPLFGEDGTYRPALDYKRDRGLLTHLKRAGLVKTFETKEPGSPRLTWIEFTEEGSAKAAAAGVRYFAAQEGK